MIAETETYRLDLIERIKADGFYVVLLTARASKFEAITLENIAKHTSWMPDISIFNEIEAEPPVWKIMALHKYLVPLFGIDRSRYFALESNHRTRRAYKAEQIVTVPREEYMVQGGTQLSLFGSEKFHFVHRFIGEKNGH